ncbi:hypothetical protein EJ08DRAFT_71094 [Tothia fuscella]|uniref:Uncharacterized protein n=1 Tax=Tothia fuscella TaxID=1048955 RepID=A0A9P4TSU4_9PEZI|nr:hypothetical protein EJ08DRAFT_71094 [Tothia fuscella]
MRDAFESKQEPKFQIHYVMAAAQWILWNGQMFFDGVVHPMPIEDRSLKFGELYTGGGSQLSIERWHFWKKGFAAASVDRDDWGDECRMLARKAENLMGAIEQGMTF